MFKPKPSHEYIFLINDNLQTVIYRVIKILIGIYHSHRLALILRPPQICNIIIQ